MYFYSSMRRSRPRVSLAVLIVLGAPVAACGAETKTLDSSATLQLSLELDRRAQFDQVAYVITGNGTAPIAGTIDTRASEATASVEVFGLPPGDGYQAAMSATSTDGETFCEGAATFMVASGQTTHLMVTLRCKGRPVLGAVRVDGTLNACAQLDEVAVSPLQTSRGSTIDVGASASDEEGDPLAYRWTAEGGAFVDPSKAETTFKCGETVEESITIEVSDDGFERCVDSWTAAVRCIDAGGAEPDWGTPVLIDTGDAGDATNPALAVDPSGNATLVWQQYDGTRTRIYASRYAGSGPWSLPVRVSNDTGDARNPEVVVDPRGNVTVVWAQDSTVYSNRYEADGPWGVAVPLGSGGAPRAAVDPSGNVTVAWVDVDEGVYATRYLAGGSWGAPESISDGLEGNVDGFGGPHLVVDPSGNVTAIWRQENEASFPGAPLRWGLMANHYSAGGAWGAAARLNEGSLLANVWSIGDVVVDLYGNVTVTWLLELRAQRFLAPFASRYPAGGPWQMPVRLNGRVWPDGAPALSVDRNGNTMTVFSDIRTDGGPLWTSTAAQSRPPGGSWGAAEAISPQVATGPTYAGSQQVVADANGNFTAVWSETNIETPRGGIWANGYLADGRWGTAVLLSDGATAAQAPRVVADPQGNVTAIWLQQTVGDTMDNPRDLYANRYQAIGSWGSAVRVSNGASTAIDHQLVVDLDGNVTSAWIQSVGTRTTIWANRYE